jgi:hypothetical protein
MLVKERHYNLIQEKEKGTSKIFQLIFGKSTVLNQLEQQVGKIEHQLTQFTNLMNLDDNLLKKIFYASPSTFVQLFSLEKICKRFKKLTDEESFKLVIKAQECPDFNIIAQKVFSVETKDLSCTQQWKKIYALYLKELKIVPKDRISNYLPINIANLSFDQLKQLRTWHRATQFIAFFNRVFNNELLSNKQRFNDLSCVREIELADALREDFKNDSENIKPLEINLEGLNLTRIPDEITKFYDTEKLILSNNSIMYWNTEVNIQKFTKAALDIGFMKMLSLKEELKKNGWDFEWRYVG